MTDQTQAHAEAHTHPGPAKYIQVAVVLFILTALEVLAYEIGHGGALTALRPTIEPIVVPILLVLSAIKFALVAMFYMHLKQDERLLSGIFVFPIILAVAIAAALIALFSVVFLLVK
jgi:heme/copper-type cytochrome/quinol oxidase subunit 4